MTIRNAFRARPGLALPATLALAATAVVCVISVFTHADPQAHAIRQRHRETAAWALAIGGLERFTAERAAVARAGMPDTTERVVFESPAGTATVELSRVRAATDDQPAVYLVRSRGVFHDGAGRPAWRAVAQFAVWQPSGFTARAAWSSARAQLPAPAGNVSGADRCNARPALPATLSGDDAAGIDWRGIVEGTALPRRATASAEAIPRYSNADTWPIIRVDGDHELRANGRGTLIVTGDLRIVGGHGWRGLVLVGGRVDLRRGASIRGALVSGLNETLGLAPADEDAIDPRARVHYDSCDLERAADAFGALVLVPDTRVSGWQPQ